MEKIGLLLGSFDPPHLGHLWAAYYALNNYVDTVWVIPAWENPWKTNQTPFEQRLKMCELFFNNREETIITMDSDGVYKSHYTYEGLEKLLANTAHFIDREYYIIGGTDVAKEIPNWKNGEWILEHFKTVAVPRSGYESAPLGIECSSTAIKNILKNGGKPIPFISENVFNYIKDNKLYL